ncbi:YbfB/YjiJ family MFS transporter [Pseudooceanicola sp. CBS1P-1]|uniref:YbfB/YjiJ family MFS transporter n=1 Tax=Pseudooceanicola albus TaxID=2692189 RepID=A0A6L7GEN7_9RHOB|nr:MULTISPECIES: YbfB/YjiJ family MFS transporter [Pseudooceanicola]MBT9387048.1 YbfB/YjiJ family MFS transporter [Pseudooceanicola endophyticus]MXN21213.1 YbfB/YjiJ family MFS transporter [Pseudooceanicola albus]
MRSKHDASATVSATLVLIVGMGVGRFAFTGLYPLMISEGTLSVSAGSYAASANYAGYLAGALLVSLRLPLSSRALCQLAGAATVLTLAVLGLSLPAGIVIAVRGISGLFSAIAMVAASHWLIHDRQQHHSAPALYAGVGLGIVLSAETIALGAAAGTGSRIIWIALAGLCSALLVPSFRRTTQGKRDIQEVGPEPRAPKTVGPQLGPWRLITIYGLAGLGYIMTATYLPLLVRTALPSLGPVQVWALFGLAAAPSCFLWHRVHLRMGTSRSLGLNLTCQAVGVGLPLLHLPIAYLASAVIVGGTFMGVVTIVMPAGRRLAHRVGFNMLAIMTAAYGFGQIIGPLIAEQVYARTSSFDGSLSLAALALFAAAGLSYAVRKGQQTATF